MNAVKDSPGRFLQFGAPPQLTSYNAKAKGQSVQARTLNLNFSSQGQGSISTSAHLLSSSSVTPYGDPMSPTSMGPTVLLPNHYQVLFVFQLQNKEGRYCLICTLQIADIDYLFRPDPLPDHPTHLRPHSVVYLRPLSSSWQTVDGSWILSRQCNYKHRPNI